MLQENWKKIQGTFHYWISDQGRVYREAYYTTYAIGKAHTGYVQRWVEGKFIKPSLAGGRGEHRYLYVTIDGVYKCVHRLVAEAFVEGRDENHYEVNHIDNDPMNNCASNLEWCNRAYNNSPERRKTLGPHRPSNTWNKDESKVAKRQEYHEYLEDIKQKRQQIKEEQQFLRTQKPEGWEEMLKENIDLKRNDYKILSKKEWECEVFNKKLAEKCIK